MLLFIRCWGTTPLPWGPPGSPRTPDPRVAKGWVLAHCLCCIFTGYFFFLLWLEPCIQGSSEAMMAAGASSVLILAPSVPRIVTARLGTDRAPASQERKPQAWLVQVPEPWALGLRPGQFWMCPSMLDAEPASALRTRLWSRSFCGCQCLLSAAACFLQGQGSPAMGRASA